MIENGNETGRCSSLLFLPPANKVAGKSVCSRGGGGGGGGGGRGGCGVERV